MTTEAVTTLDSVDEMAETGSVSSEIVSGSYRHSVRITPSDYVRYLDVIASVDHFQRRRPETFLDVLSSYRHHETNFWDKTPIQPSQATTSAERFNFPVSWPYGGSHEVLIDFDLHNVGAVLPFLRQWLARARVTREDYALRIKELRGYASEDGFQVNPSSEEDFWSFMNSALFGNRPGLVLMENGNLRAVWRGAESSHVGIQFLGEQKAEYVVFRRRTASDDVSRVAGIDTLNGIKQQIRAFGLASLVNV